MAGPTIRPGGAGGPGRGPGRGMRPGGKPKDMQKTLLRLWDYISTDKVTLAFVFFCVIFSTVSWHICRGYCNAVSAVQDHDRDIAEGPFKTSKRFIYESTASARAVL